MGLVPEVFDPSTLARLRARAAVGHVRYSTTGGNVARQVAHELKNPLNVANITDGYLELIARAIKDSVTIAEDRLACMSSVPLRRRALSVSLQMWPRNEA